MKPMKVYVFIILLAFFSKVYSQQEAQQSLYFFNPLLVNPGYAGSQEALSVTGIVRNQWVGFKGAPQTQCLSIHSPLKNDHLNIGLSFVNDQLGATKNTGVFADFAYSIRLNSKNHRLVFGLKAGVDFYRSSFSKLAVNDNTDELYVNGYNYATQFFNAGGGIYYYGRRFYIGASSPRLIKNAMTISGENVLAQANHYYGFAGIVLKLNSRVNMRPSFMLKYTQNAPVSVDANLSFLFYDKVWIGGMYRYNSAAGANIMFKVSQSFSIGYAYDFTLNAVNNYSKGSHEIMLGYNLRGKTGGFVSPRYF